MSDKVVNSSNLGRKRPDGVNIIPPKCGKLLVWDVTCPDMFSPSYLHPECHHQGWSSDYHGKDRKSDAWIQVAGHQEFVTLFH